MINSELIRNVIKNSSTYGILLSALGGISIFLYSIYNTNIFVHEKETGDNFVTIQLSAFAPPSPDPIAEQIQKPKHKPQHRKYKKHKERIEAPTKPVPTPFQAMEKIQQETQKTSEQIHELQETKEVPVAQTATTVQSNPDAQAQQNIRTIRFSDGVDNAFLRAIRSAVEKRHKYPNLAQQRGFEGEVLVKFLIATNGEVSKIQIVRACPHDVLNKAAIKTVQKASRDFPKPNETTYIEIPIAYTLNNHF
ncbi:energy transducer TonB [Helicobacter aurati]|uniref:Energy transducer TonB n=1 Tax=Helicobacter aurati TaxID=137778 RepID=A0A3D8IYB2_9HELI|nr:energy transducer TonB [Helicobacter aurati]RDU70257.1 energy transducer TonB [Helicobacter aurati]